MTPLPGLATSLHRAWRRLRWVAFCLLLCAAPALHAQSYALDVQPASQAVPTAEPRKIVTLRFRVANRGAAGQFAARVDAPPGWQIMALESPFQLGEGEERVRSVKLLVPDAAPAGEHAVTFTVSDPLRPDLRSSAKMVVPVTHKAPDTSANGARAETLLLDVRINDQPLPGIIHARRLADGRLALPADAWTAARLRPAGVQVALPDAQQGYVLEAVPGLTYKLDRVRLTLSVTAPANAFDETMISINGGRAGLPTESPPGFYANYDLFATGGSGGSASYGALIEGIYFHGSAALVAGAAVSGDRHSQSYVRTETYWRKDLPGRMETLVIGDTVGTGGAWSQPVRFGGVRYARDFSLAPGYITYPMPSISGSAALPSTVDVLINNKRSASANVQTGPFDLTNVPIVTGAGELQLVVRDLAGRETVITQSYYVAPQLLAPGLSDFSYEAGAFRENYGTRSNDYGPLFAAGTYRRGLTDTVTGEVRAEAQADRGAAGAGIAAVVGQLGIVGLAGGYAVSDSERGGHYLASVQRSGPEGAASIAWGHSDRGYRAFGTGAGDRRPRDMLAAAGGASLGAMTVGMSYVRQTSWNGDPFTLAGASLTIPLPGNVFLGMSVNKQLEAGSGWTGGLNLIIPFDGGRSITATTTRSANGSGIL